MGLTKGWMCNEATMRLNERDEEWTHTKTNSSKKLQSSKLLRGPESPNPIKGQISHINLCKLYACRTAWLPPSQGLYSLARCGLHLPTKTEKVNIWEIKNNMKLFHLYYNYIQLNSISNNHSLTPSIPQAECSGLWRSTRSERDEAPATGSLWWINHRLVGKFALGKLISSIDFWWI